MSVYYYRSIANMSYTEKYISATVLPAGMAHGI